MIEAKITNLIEQALNGLGYELVRVKIINGDIIQVMIDSDSGVGIDDCSESTRLINNILQVEGISDNFSLEVTSPGLDRPLIKPDHFIKFIGYNIKLNSQKLIDGQKRFVGKLTGFNKENNHVEITCEDKLITIALDQVQSANLQYEFKNIKKKNKK